MGARSGKDEDIPRPLPDVVHHDLLCTPGIVREIKSWTTDGLVEAVDKVKASAEQANLKAVATADDMFAGCARPGSRRTKSIPTSAEGTLVWFLATSCIPVVALPSLLPGADRQKLRTTARSSAYS